MTDPVAATRGRIGGNTLAARTDMRQVAARARAGFYRKFEREVDPEGVLDPDERARRVQHAISAYYARLSLRAAEARRRAARHKEQAL